MVVLNTGNIPSIFYALYGQSESLFITNSTMPPVIASSNGTVITTIDFGLSDPTLPAEVGLIAQVSTLNLLWLTFSSGASRFSGDMVLKFVDDDLVPVYATIDLRIGAILGNGQTILPQYFQPPFIEDGKYINICPISVEDNPDSLPLLITMALSETPFTTIDSVIDHPNAEAVVPPLGGGRSAFYGNNAPLAKDLYFGCVYDVDGDQGLFTSYFQDIPHFSALHKKYDNYITGPENVCVVYNSQVPAAVTVANYYKNARYIPNENMIGINTGLYFPLQSYYATHLQMVPFADALLAATDLIKNKILYYLFIGDFPLQLSATQGSLEGIVATRSYLAGGAWRTGTASTYQTEYDVWQASNHVWRRDGEEYNAFTGQRFLPSSGWYMIPPATELLQYSNDRLIPNVKRYGELTTVFRIPVGNFAEEVDVAIDRIDSMIAKENEKSMVWGTTIAREGGSASDAVSITPLMQDMLDVSNDLKTIPSNFYYSDVTAEWTDSGGNDIGDAHTDLTPIHMVAEGLTGIPRSNDVGNNAKHLLMSSFPNSLGDVFCISSGVRSYYSTGEYDTPASINKVMEEGDIDLEDGAIAVFSQSYGSVKAPATSESSRELADLTEQVELSFPVVNSDTYEDHIWGYNRHGTTRKAFRLTILVADAAEAPTLEITTTNIIIRRAGFSNYSYVYTGQTWEQILTGMKAALLSALNIKIYIEDGESGLFWSRSYAAWRAGFCYASGVSGEPHVGGQCHSGGLYSTIFSGYSFGERAFLNQSNGRIFLRQRWTHYTNYWCQYGDPLYRPFGHFLDHLFSRVVTAAGTIIAVSDVLPIEHTRDAFEALNFVDISEIVDGGSGGKAYNKVDYSPIKNSEVLSVKGSYGHSPRVLTLGRDITDAGQALLLAGLEVDDLYAFRITFQDDSVMYITATIDSFTDNIETIDSIVGATVSLVQYQETIRVN